MKYLVMLGDGMGDRPLPEFDMKTPLGAANIPCMDNLARKGDCGLVHMLREGLPLGSDVANLSVLGYEPARYYTGRSPIEALGLGLPVGEDDMVFRTNLINTRGTGAEEVMVDHSSDKITDAEGRELCTFLQEKLGGGEFDFYFGASYRNIMIWHGGRKVCGADLSLTPPHDILERKIAGYLPAGGGADILWALCEKAAAILADHPVNVARRERGLKDANRIWFWGEGTKPGLSSFEAAYGISGAMVTAVPLLAGIARGTGMKLYEVEGATGDIHTNFEGKAEAAVTAFREGADLVFVHVEAPDECGHDGNAEEKKLSIEYIDRRILTPVTEYLAGTGEPYGVLLLPDHATPICERTHTLDAIPFVRYCSHKAGTHPAAGYSEAAAAATGLVEEKGTELMAKFLSVK